MAIGETIFALSSGAPPAAIAIVRISGTGAFDATRKLAGFVPQPRHAALATLRDFDGAFLDQALVLCFPGPNSATGEDLAELHLHGGRAVVRAVEACLERLPGLRKAEAGEFTRRAFQHGRIDLNEADGLSDMLAAETEHQRRAAANMFGGAFTRSIEAWRAELLRISALTEAELDFSDEGDVESQNNRLISNACNNLRAEIKGLLEKPTAEKLRDGLRVVLAGPPNSGKSTLLNALVGREAAIVSDIAGTTRDVIEAPIAFMGIPLIFTDTAGMRDDHGDSIEAMGIERAKAALSGADIILWLGAQGSGPDHPSLIEIEAMADLPVRSTKSTGLRLSAKTGEGVPILISEIVSLAKSMLPPADGYAVNARQREYLGRVAESLTELQETKDWLIVGEHLRIARLALDALTGRTHTEDLLDSLFGKFCVGK
jgi:tRNA modification GTPase